MSKPQPFRFYSFSTVRNVLKPILNESFCYEYEKCLLVFTILSMLFICIAILNLFFPFQSSSSSEQGQISTDSSSLSSASSDEKEEGELSENDLEKKRRSLLEQLELEGMLDYI